MLSKMTRVLVLVMVIALLAVPTTAQAWWTSGGYLTISGVKTAASHIPMTDAAAKYYGMKSTYIPYCNTGSEALDNAITSAVVCPYYHFNNYHTATYNYPEDHRVYWDSQDSRIEGFNYWLGQAKNAYAAGKYTTAAHKIGNALHCIEDISGHGQMAPACHQICGLSPDTPSFALLGMTAAQRVTNGNTWVRTYMAKAKAAMPKLFN